MSDIPRVFSATQFEGFNDGMTWNAPQEMKELNEYHEGIKARWEKGEIFNFSIYQRDSDLLLGRISVQPTEKLIGELGYWTHPDVQGQGIMTEVVPKIAEFSFRALKVTSVVAKTMPWNIPSEKVLQNCGFEFVKLEKKGCMKMNKWHKANIWKLVM